MANLIITVISIALVAVAALMGAYYGGSAFIDGQAKAQANALVSGMEQIMAARRLYALDNGGSYALSDNLWSDGTATDLVPKYLAALPSFSFISQRYPIVADISNGSYIGITNSNVTGALNLMEVYGITEKLCKQINFIATGTASAPTTTWVGFTDSAAGLESLKPFACTAYVDVSQTYYSFDYRVF